jgi:S-adenosylmethionine:tRNA ribosyltransferase-isomerase
VEISNPREIHIEDYNYDLPDERIAKYPLDKRNNSKLLVYKNGTITDSLFNYLVDFVLDNTFLVFNNTKVIQARLYFQKSTGAQIEIFCLEPYSPNNYLLNFQQTSRCSWICLIGNLKKWKEGQLKREIVIEGNKIELIADRIQSVGDSHIVEFTWNNPDYTFSELLEVIGELPIPPYLNRKAEEHDKETYQTVYSKIEGSVAAPTAGLHFTEEVFSSLQEKGIETAEVTLHVGAGTFRPVKSEKIEGHMMHSEYISVKKEVIEQLLNHKRTIIAVGTTSVRTLESLYYIGLNLQNGDESDMNVSQWQPYDEAIKEVPVDEALRNIINYLNNHGLDSLIAHTQIIIAPGYKFKLVDGIITNFHQPQSTLLLLVSAFTEGSNWKKIYSHALTNNYRFLSYGDSSLLLK